MPPSQSWLHALLLPKPFANGSSANGFSTNGISKFAANGNLQDNSMSARTPKPGSAQESDKVSRGLDKK
jgi:hypothetical protein